MAFALKRRLALLGGGWRVRFSDELGVEYGSAAFPAPAKGRFSEENRAAYWAAIAAGFAWEDHQAAKRAGKSESWHIPPR